MGNPSNRLVVLVLGVLCPLCFGCGEEPVQVFGENSFTYQVEYTPGTVILKKEQLPLIVKDEKTAVSTTDPVTKEQVTIDHHTFTLSDIQLASSLKAGTILIVHGRYLTRVKTVKTQGTQLVVETEPAKLTDAVKNGTIQWDITPDIHKMQTISVSGQPIKAVRRALGPDGSGYEYKYDWLDRKYTIWMNPHGTSENGLPEIQVNFIVQKVDKDNGKVTGTFGAKGITRLPRQATTIGIQNSTVTTFTSKSSALRSELTFEYVAKMSLGGTQDISFPKLTLSIPIQSLTSLPVPLPLNINLGLAFSTTVNMPEVTSWASAKLKLILDSDTGFEYKGPKIEANAKIHGYELGTSDWEIGMLSITPSPLEVRFDVACPRMGLDLAGTELAWMAGVFSVRSKLLVPSLCKASFHQVRLDGGYSLSFLGLPIAEKTGAITEVSRTESSPECE